MQLYLLVCCYPRVTRLKYFSLHLYTFIQFQAAMNRRFVTCFRDVAIHLIAVSRTLHSSNHNAFMVKKYRKWSFWELSNRFWRCNIVLSRRPPLYLYTAGHGPTDFINCDNSGMQMKNLKLWSSETACHDYINLHLYAFLSMAIFTPAWRNFFMNLTSVIITSSATFS